MKKVSIKTISVIAATLFLVACGQEKVGEVNGRAVTTEAFDSYLSFKRVPKQDEKRVETLLKDYMQREALADLISDTDLVDPAVLEAELNEFRKQMMISRYFEQFLNEKVSDDALKNYYATHAEEFQQEKIKVAHILFRTHEKMSDAERQALLTQAQEAYSKARAGGSFAELAEQYSQDTISAKQGGELGWVRRGAIDPVFSGKVFEMNAGDISEPFASPFGYHVVKVQEDAQTVTTPFEKVQGDIRYRLRQQAKQAEMERLLAEADISYQ